MFVTTSKVDDSPSGVEVPRNEAVARVRPAACAAAHTAQSKR